jgi:glycosyltransferase involved in cell wall biosynthesis
MRRSGVRMVAVSAFSAGALLRDCRATVLPPSLSGPWFDTLGSAAAGRGHAGSMAAGTAAAAGIRLVTTFRLADWRGKGLPELVAAVAALGRPDVGLTVCGSGNPPTELVRLVASHRWCTLRAGLADGDLAREIAAADLFVLATRTRRGRRCTGEGFGMALLEAQAAGTPVIAPAHGGSHDAYVAGVTGEAPADESVEALTAVLGELLKDPARLAWMGGRAARWAREAFAPERYPRLVSRTLL